MRMSTGYRKPNSSRAATATPPHNCCAAATAPSQHRRVDPPSPLESTPDLAAEESIQRRDGPAPSEQGPWPLQSAWWRAVAVHAPGSRPGRRGGVLCKPRKRLRRRPPIGEHGEDEGGVAAAPGATVADAWPLTAVPVAAPSDPWRRAQPPARRRAQPPVQMRRLARDGAGRGARLGVRVRRRGSARSGEPEGCGAEAMALRTSSSRPRPPTAPRRRGWLQCRRPQGQARR
ncbi:hypothetical protein EJB05_27265, partial [Eragrostis curvula]